MGGVELVEVVEPAGLLARTGTRDREPNSENPPGRVLFMCKSKVSSKEFVICLREGVLLERGVEETGEERGEERGEYFQSDRAHPSHRADILGGNWGGPLLPMRMVNV